MGESVAVTRIRGVRTGARFPALKALEASYLLLYRLELT